MSEGEDEWKGVCVWEGEGGRRGMRLGHGAEAKRVEGSFEGKVGEGGGRRKKEWLAKDTYVAEVTVAGRTHNFDTAHPCGGERRK